MKFYVALIFAFALMPLLNAQSEKFDLALNLVPGNTYQLEIQEQASYPKSKKQLAVERESSRSTESTYLQTKVFQLEVIEKKEEHYLVELVSGVTQSFTANERSGISMRNLPRYTGVNNPIIYADTVRFEMDKYARIINQIEPDSFTTGYAVADTFRLETRVVLPDLIKEFSTLFSYLHPEPVSVGSSWKSSLGNRFTLAKQQGNLLQITSKNSTISIDLESRWIKFEELYLSSGGLTRFFPDRTERHYMIRGRLTDQPKPIVITGFAPNHKNGSFLLRITPYAQGADAVHLIKVDKEGHFTWRDTVSDPIFFQITDLYQSDFWGYIQPENKIELTLNSQDQWELQGDAPEESRYLNAFFASYPLYSSFIKLGDRYKWLRSESINFNQFWQEQLNELEKAIDQLTNWTKDLSPEFVAFQKQQIDHFRAGALNQYLREYYVSLVHPKGKVVEIPSYYLDYLDQLILYNNISRCLPAYRALLHLHLTRKMAGSVSGDLRHILVQPYDASYYFAQLHYFDYPLYQTTYDLVDNAIARYGEPDRINHLYQHLQKVYADIPADAALNKHYQQMLSLETKGNSLPNIAAFDSLNQQVSLKDLDGQPVVFLVVNGFNFWSSILMIEDTHQLFPDIQFVFLHIGDPEKEIETRRRNIDGEKRAPPTGENIIHWYAKSNSAAAAHGLMHYRFGRHPRAYFLDRSGKIVDFVKSQERYDHVLNRLEYLQAGKPLIDKQSQQGILLILLGIICGGLLIGLIVHQRQRHIHQKEYARRRQVEVQLQAIRSQLNPHFMFNSMSAIQHLIASRQPERAQSYLGKLANLLRVSLRYNREDFISLQEELDAVEQYCELEALRFNFSYDFKVDRQLDTRAISIPPMLLQPYVENAVLHGIAPLREQGRLKVGVTELNQQLWITIWDNGQGMQSSKPSLHHGNGIGLTLNAERLRLVYGDSAKVHINSPAASTQKTQSTGTEVQIAMPMDV